MPDQRDTLALVFARDLVRANGAALFLNAAPLPDGALRGAACEQGFRPDFLALEAAGYDAAPERETAPESEAAPRREAAGGHDLAALLLGRSRQVNERNLARAWNALRPGGTLVVAGDKTAGIAPIRKLAASRAVLSDSLAKHHATAFWAVREGDDWPVPDLAREAEGFRLLAGQFSADGPDPASRLLASHLDGRPLGRTADLGAGWGYLAAQALRRAKPTSVELFEADHAALAAARGNVAADVPLAFHWHDVAGEPIERRFDTVVMNPPFHAGSGGAGRAAEPRIGQRFIERASEALLPKGRLLMVANRNLPYERTLAERFRSWEKLEEAAGFKVLEAVR